MSSSGQNRKQREIDELAKTLQEMASQIGAEFVVDEQKSLTYLAARVAQEERRQFSTGE